MKEVKFTYSRQRSGHEVSEKLCEMKTLKSAILSHELLLHKKINSSEKRTGSINTANLKDITNVLKENIPKAYPNGSLIKREEIPSICSSPYYPGAQIKRKADKSSINSQSEQPDLAEPMQKHKGKTKCKKHSSKRQMKGMNISVSKAARKTDNIAIVIRPEDIAGKGFIWVKNTK